MLKNIATGLKLIIAGVAGIIAVSFLGSCILRVAVRFSSEQAMGIHWPEDYYINGMAVLIVLAVILTVVMCVGVVVEIEVEALINALRRRFHV